MNITTNIDCDKFSNFKFEAIRLNELLSKYKTKMFYDKEFNVIVEFELKNGVPYDAILNADVAIQILPTGDKKIVKCRYFDYDTERYCRK